MSNLLLVREPHSSATAAHGGAKRNLSKLPTTARRERMRHNNPILSPDGKSGGPGRVRSAALVWLMRGHGKRRVPGFFWWARQDLNLQPDRYERSELPGNPCRFSTSRSRPFTLMRVWSLGFCGISVGRIASRRRPAICTLFQIFARSRGSARKSVASAVRRADCRFRGKSQTSRRRDAEQQQLVFGSGEPMPRVLGNKYHCAFLNWVTDVVQ